VPDPVKGATGANRREKPEPSTPASARKIESLPEFEVDSAQIRKRPTSPAEVLAEMVRRAKELEEARKAAVEAAREVPKAAPGESPRVAAGEAPKVAAEEAPKVAAEEAPKVAAEEAPKVAAEEAPKVAAEEAPKATGEAGKVGPTVDEVTKTPAPDARKRALKDILGQAGEILESATRPQGARTADDSTRTAPPPKPKHESISSQKGFLGRVWDRVSSWGGKAVDAVSWAGSKIWGFAKSLVGKLWDGIKWVGDKTRITDGLKWLGPKISQGFEWFKHKAGWLVFGVSFEDFKTRKVVDDPGDVNRPDWDEIEKAKKEIKSRAAEEKAALDKLSPEQKKQYETLAKLSEGRPLSRWALQSLLLGGKLTGEKALRGEKTLLEELDRLATQSLGDGINREEIVSDLIAEIENPVRINQQGKGTCVATTAQILLTRKHPAEYARIVADLARPVGEAKTAKGGTLKRNKDWADSSDAGRSVPSRLIQPALMDMGQMLPQPILDYDNTKDKTVLGPIPLAGGLTGGGSATINTELQNRDYDSHTFFHWNRNSKWNTVKEALAQGKGPIPCGLVWGTGGGHQLQIDKVENGTVHYTNPWGQLETMDEAEFKAHIMNAEIPK
jgi:hypothetical protein